MTNHNKQVSVLKLSSVDLTVVNKYDSVTEAGKSVGSTRNAVSTAINQRVTLNNFYFVRESEFLNTDFSDMLNNNNIRCEVINLKNGLKYKFKSVHLASKVLGIWHTYIFEQFKEKNFYKDDNYYIKKL